MGPEEYYKGKEYGALHVNAMFETLLHPPNLIQQFKTLNDFKLWTETGTIEDIEEMEKEFILHELYDHLIIIRDVVIKKKEDQINN